LFYILGLIAVPFLPETKGKPLPEADSLSLAQAGEHLHRRDLSHRSLPRPINRQVMPVGEAHVE
jgi:hypothetical protein